MIEKSYFEYMYADTTNPIVISDRVTNEVVFMNKPMEKFLEKLPENALGNTCYQTIHHSSTSCDACDKELMSVGKCCERFISHESLGTNLKVVTTIIDLNGELFNACKYFVYLQDNPNYSFAEASDDFLRAVAKTDVDDAINTCLEIAGKFYNAERSYIFKVNQVDKSLFCQYAWVDENDDLNRDDVAPASLNLILDRLVANVDGIIDFNYERSLPTLNKLEQVFLVERNIKNLAIRPIYDSKGVIIAFLGVSNRHFDNPLDSRILKAVGTYIEQNVEKSRLITEIKANTDIDALTGLFKRIKYSQVVDDITKNNPKSIGAIFTNINGLKRVNAEDGYTAGDKLIAKSAKLLQKALPDNTFFRISGDEFVTIFENATSEYFEENVATLRNAIKNQGEHLLAVGHSFETGRNIDIVQLIHNADTLMYINKQEYYHANHTKASQKPSDEVLNDLMYAIDNDEFLVYLQPKVRLEDSVAVGAEALIRRFSKKENKMIFPDQFISIYEKSSIIRHVDIFVLEKVCKILKEWKKTGKAMPVSVNLSRVTLMEYDIVQTITNICKKFDLDTKYIVIEITERIGLLENNIASKLITDFKAQGFPLSLDDFGCAYSNIVTLAKIDVEEVKIDKSLIDDLLTNEKNRVIVDNVLNMCSSFEGTYAVAEGIETEEQAEALRKYGCIYGQGYFYSRPIPNEEFFEKYIKAS
ncbi:MAG: GGDEF domain-containing phosphodiesterase [Clostridia bacterium]